MLRELIESGFEKDYNCAERIINGANIAYDLGLDKQACKLMAGFGGGMGIGVTCGALAAAVAVLSSMFVEDYAKESPRVKELSTLFFRRFRQRMPSDSFNCLELKQRYRTPAEGCKDIDRVVAEILDQIVLEEGVC